jgi:hypothetical protein
MSRWRVLSCCMPIPKGRNNIRRTRGFRERLRAEILAEHSKRQTMRIVRMVGDDAKRFTVLMDVFLNEEYRITQRAAWAVSYCAEAHPKLIRPYLRRMIENLKKPVHDAVKRNTVRVLQGIDLPTSLLGSAADVCFTFLQSVHEPAAIKANSITVLANICRKEPELKNEFRLILQQHMPFGSPAIIARAKKVLKELEPQTGVRVYNIP